MSADFSPSNEPTPPPSAPIKTRRLFRQWKRLLLLVVGACVVYGLWVFSASKPFDNPRERLIGSWVKGDGCGSGIHDVMHNHIPSDNCLTVFNPDGTLDTLDPLALGGDLMGYSMGSGTYSWLNDTTLRIHWTAHNEGDETVAVTLGPWWSNELTLHYAVSTNLNLQYHRYRGVLGISF